MHGKEEGDLVVKSGPCQALLRTWSGMRNPPTVIATYVVELPVAILATKKGLWINAGFGR
jgi:hypothetical protein